jgi:hypothetical protein
MRGQAQWGVALAHSEIALITVQPWIALAWGAVKPAA